MTERGTELDQWDEYVTTLKKNIETHRNRIANKRIVEILECRISLGCRNKMKRNKRNKSKTKDRKTHCNGLDAKELSSHSECRLLF